MTSANSSLAEALIDIIKPIVEEAVRRILCISSHEAQPEAYRAEAFLTVKQASDISSLAPVYPKEANLSAKGWASGAHKKN